MQAGLPNLPFALGAECVEEIKERLERKKAARTKMTLLWR